MIYKLLKPDFIISFLHLQQACTFSAFLLLDHQGHPLLVLDVLWNHGETLGLGDGINSTEIRCPFRKAWLMKYMYIWCIYIYISLGSPSYHPFLLMGFPWNKPSIRICYIYIFIWVNFITTSLRPSPGIMVNKGNHPQMAARFRLVKFCNLPTYI